MVINFSKGSNEYSCFSNFYLCQVEYDGITYGNSEAAWQSLKAEDYEVRKSFALLSPTEAKRKGRKIVLRDDWENVKYHLMVDICFAKFSQNPDLKEILISTGDRLLVENTIGWHDNEWGNCTCSRCANIEGKNLLGKALMVVRKELTNEK